MAIIRKLKAKHQPLVKRRRKASKSQRRKKIQAMLNKHLHRRWAQTEEFIEVVSSNTSTNFEAKSLTFSLDKIVNYTELQSMYDQYKINFVEMYLMWSPEELPVAEGAGTGGVIHNRSNLVPPSLQLYHLADYDDDTDLTENQFKERSKTRLTLLKPQQKKKIVIKPAVLSQIYETTVSTGYAPKFNLKLDSNDANVPHYGYKFGIKTPVNSSNGQMFLGKITIQIRYNLTMFNTK